MLKWYGAQVEARVMNAVRLSMDGVMADCVAGAKSQLYPGHGYKTGTLQGSIEMRPAKRQGLSGLLGVWGSFNVLYAIYVEVGTALTTGLNFLRGTADIIYPTLADRVRRRLSA